jgi:hypothetical protein
MDDSDVSEEDEQEQVQWCEELNQYQMGRALTDQRNLTADNVS